MSRNSSFRRIVFRTVLVVAVAVALAGCNIPTPVRGELAANQAILATCDLAAPPASLVEIDGSGSSASEQITAERMVAIEEVVRRTAICSGHLRVLVFSASSAATTALFDAPLHLEGATENAQLRRVPKVVEEAMAEIRAAYEPAVAALPGGGTDITAQYRHASEWAQQLDGNARLHLVVFTDGFENVGGVKLGKKALSKQEATALAERVSVPELPGASVVVAGLGRVAGTPPSSETVEGLVAFYQTICTQTGAEDCLSVTEYAGAAE